MVAERKEQFATTLVRLLNDPNFSPTRAEFAAAIGISQSALSQYTSMKAKPRIDVLARMANAFGVSADYLLFGSDGMNAARAPDRSTFEYFDNLISSYKQRIDSHAWTSSRIAAALYGRLETLVSEALTTTFAEVSSSRHAGMIDDAQLYQLEGFAKRVDIISLTFHYDIEIIDGEAVPGRFAPVVAERLRQGAKYRFIMPRGDDFRKLGLAYRTLMQRPDMAGSAATNLFIRSCDRPPPSGLGIYHLDMPKAKKEAPLLVEMLDEFIVNSDLGYIIPPSKLVQADSVMDRAHLERANQYFQHLWDANKISPL